MESRQQPWHPFRHPGLCGLRGTMCFLFVISLVIVVPISFLLDTQHAQTNTNTTTRSQPVNVTTSRLRRNRRSVLENPFNYPDVLQNNAWLLYANYTTRQHTDRSCLFCMPARPELMVMPTTYTSENCAANPLYNVKHHYTCKFFCDLYFTNRDLANKILDLCSHFIPTSDFTQPPRSLSPPQKFSFISLPELN